MIRGVLMFDSDVVDLSGATVAVRLLDVSRADAVAQVLAESRLPPLPAGATSAEAIRFSLEDAPVDPRGTYTIAVHVDRDGDGAVSPGDYITMEQVVVDAAAHSATVHVPVRMVG